MAKTLTQTINNQITNRKLGISFIFKISGIDYSDYLISWAIDFSKEFGSASAQFVLHNNTGLFNENGASSIKVGNVVEFIEKYENDNTEFKKFYGIVNQRSITKEVGTKTITLVCLDYISVLQHLDIDLVVEGDKIKVENETLTPNYLPSPRDMYSQVFNFANDAVADNPRPILSVKDKNSLEEDPAWDGMEILYDVGQVKLGAPLQALDNYDLIAQSYYYYTRGLYVEDVLEQILTEVDGYGNYLFGEASAASVISNHLTTSYLTEEGVTGDTMTCNLTATELTVYCALSQTYDPLGSGVDPTVLYVSDITSLPTSGSASINGDLFSWTGKNETLGCLTGIPTSGAYSLDKHEVGAYVKYEATYAIGQVWYLKYSNVQTNLTAGNFSISNSGIFKFFDKRYGRIILEAPISILSTVICTSDYTFKTLQATGIEINRITFRSRELANRFEAITKLRNYVAPNYCIRTVGDNKIWSSYLTQKTVEDYNLTLVKSIDFLEDEDLYTRCIWYGKNKNPTNILFNDGVDFLTTGNDYKATADKITMSYSKTEEGWHYFTCPITDAGYISAQTMQPKVWIDGVLVDNTAHYLQQQPVKWQVSTKTVTTTSTTQASSGGGWCCFIAGTKVKMGDGTDRDIELIRVGEYVATYNLETGYHEKKKVLKRYNHKASNLIKMTTSDGQITIGTDDHPYFIIGRGWCSSNPELTEANYHFKAFELKVGDNIFTYDDTTTVVTSIEKLNEEREVYTLFVQHNPNFYVNGFLNHNGGGDEGTTSSTTTTTYTTYTYRIYFAHQNIVSSQPIIVYNSFADQSRVIPSGDGNMDYGRGVYYVPGSAENEEVEQASSASYYVFYGDDNVNIDYDNVIIKVKQSLISDPNEALVQATFTYWTHFTSVRDIKNVIDGRWNTQVQSEYYAEPPTGYQYAILDMGAVYDVQAFDVVAGFYRPDDTRRYDIDFRFSLQYSLDNVDYYDISDETNNVQLTGGQAVSFEEDALGVGFQARYFRLVLEDVKNIPFKTEKGVYVVAFTEIAAYGDIVIKGEAKLVPTTQLTVDANPGDTTVYVSDTTGFTEPSSAMDVETAYIAENAFTYTGLTATTFTGCTITTGGIVGDRVHKTIKEDDTELYDDTGLLPTLGDRLFKQVNINDNLLYTQTQIEYQALSVLREFIKNHTKLTVDVMYSPYLQVGQTVRLIDPFTATDRRYFIERITDNNGAYALVLAYYPA